MRVGAGARVGVGAGVRGKARTRVTAGGRPGGRAGEREVARVDGGEEVKVRREHAAAGDGR